MNRSRLIKTARNLGLRPIAYNRGTAQYWRGVIDDHNREVATRRDRRIARLIASERRARLRASERRSRERARERILRERNEVGTQAVDRMIEGNQFQEILNMAVSQRLRLTLDQAQRYWNRLIADGRYVMILRVPNAPGLDGQHITVSQSSKEFLLEILMKGYRTHIRKDEPGSDLLDNIDINQIVSIDLVRQVADRKMPDRDGRFFPYLNTSKLDLSRYQIYDQDDAYNRKLIDKRDHCLIHALSLSGVSRTVLNRIKLSHIEGANIRVKDLKHIAKTIKRNIIVHRYDGGRIRKQSYKTDQAARGAEDVMLAISQNHYFIYEDSNYSKLSVTRYRDLYMVDNYTNIVRVDQVGDNTYYRYDEHKSRINSLTMVNTMLQDGLFDKLDMVCFEEASSHKELRDHVYLDDIANEQVQCEYGVAENMTDIPRVYFADCESFVNGDHHELYMLGVVSSSSDIVDILNVCDRRYADSYLGARQTLVNDFMKLMTRNGTRDVICYFHNLKYDYHLMEPYLKVDDRCEKDGQLYSVTCHRGKAKVELRDSFKMIPVALSKFGSMFDLPSDLRKKEAISYEYYEPNNHNMRIPVSDYRMRLSYNDRIVFDEMARQCPSYDGESKTFNPTTYYRDYLRMDCLVLKHGVQKFSDLISDITGGSLSIYNSLTISSLTDQYMGRMGAYRGVYKICANLRAYVAKAVYGGRVNCNETKNADGTYMYKKRVIERKIADYDGVSLYPSAINRLCRPSTDTETSHTAGLPTGMAVRFDDQFPLDNWRDTTYAIMTVRITAVNKHQQIPFIAYKNDSSISYLNEPPPEPIVIDKITLEDYIQYHDIEYELLDGVYWNSGTNDIMGKLVRRLFRERLKYKSSNPAMANTLKLMLNSSYGKTIMKKTKTEKVLIRTKNYRYNKTTEQWEVVPKTNLKNFVYNNFNSIKSYRQLNATCWEFTRLKADDSYNRGHIGCAILSMSKRIMNEVFDVANDNGLPIYYTDTDSLHCNYDDVPILEAKYGERYGKTLNGKELEQFHVDFDLKGAADTIYATKSIFLGKKSYIDYLESHDKDGNVINGYHIRLKGITAAGLEHAAKKYSDVDVPEYFRLYEDLASGNKVDILLNPINDQTGEKKVLFAYGAGKVFTRQEFVRTVRF